jgi:MFS transporter, DHA2 family, multidrug resistance protein
MNQPSISAFGRAMIVLTTISAAVMELIDTSIVNVALAAISGNLGSTIEDTAWVITSYAIANVIIIPLTGFFAKLFGRKRYYIASIIIFTIASYMCGMSSSLPMLVFWRFIQGIGGGALLSTSQGILFDVFEPAKRSMAAGMFGMGIVIGPTIGPILGGIIIDNYHWPLIFDINIPFGLVATLLASRFVPDDTEEQLANRKSTYIDYIGISFLTIGIGSLQYVLERGESEDWFDSKTILISSILATVGLITFVYRQLTIENPVINLTIMKNGNLLASNILTFVCGFGLFGSIFIFPVLTQRVFGYTPTDAGLGLVPSALVAIVAMPIIGKTLGSGTPPIYYVILGFASFILHGYTSSLANLDADLIFFIVPQILRGIGTACLIVPLINQAVVGLEPKDLPSGIALTNMLRQLGGAFGIAMMNTYITMRYAVHRTDLVSNLQVFDTETTQRLATYKAGAMAGGMDAFTATALSYKIADLTITKQGFLLAYLDGYKLISLFFLVTIPFMFMLKTKKMDQATIKKIQEESH